MKTNRYDNPDQQIKQMQVPLLDLQREYADLAREIEPVMRRVSSGAGYILGPEVELLEAEVSAYLGTKHCIAVASGTDALVIALRALAIMRKRQEYFDRQDEIITTPFTFTATGGAILRAGATPVFVDIDPKTYNICPEQVEKAINRHTVGVLPVHLYGNPCQMDQIMELARANDHFVLEDAAQAFGAGYRGKKMGVTGTAGAFSFFPSKNLGGFGDGGAVAAGDDGLAEIVKMLRTHGGKDKYDAEHIGYNSRLDTLQAAILLVKLKHVDRLNSLRSKIASFYDENLHDLDWLTTPEIVEGGAHGYNQYTVRIKKGKRDLVRAKLKEKGVTTAVYYPVPLHRMKVFAGRCRIAGDLVRAEKACAEVLSLPIEPLLRKEELDYVISSLRRIYI